MSRDEHYSNWSILLTLIFVCLSYGGIINMNKFYIWLPLGSNLALSFLGSLLELVLASKN